ncbi:MAG: 5-formyltetrahydrofolate cyclo-ligase [Betaproteobacteria bacterium]
MAHATDRDHDPPRGAALRAAKLAVRRQVLVARDALSTEFRATAAQTIADRLAALPSFAGARAVLLTFAFRSEWDTLPLVRAALAAGKVVAVPRVNAATRMLDLFAVTDPAADVSPGFQGIPEPHRHCAPVAIASIDWVLVPGVAFDAVGRRLGYGGGYYDRLLPLVPADAARVAGAFDLQIVDRVPAAPHDLTVDAIVTEARTLIPPALK